jgi:hypothetical protein
MGEVVSIVPNVAEYEFHVLANIFPLIEGRADVGGPWHLVDDISSQFGGVDMRAGNFSAEIKTELLWSSRLFVQTAERGHNVHCLRNGGQRYSSVRPLA